MRNKLMAVVLSCLTFLTLFVSALVPMQASAVSVDEMTRAAVSIITSNEGTYGSVNRNDCGAVSVGMLQWHANRALQLMRSIAEADPASAQSILGGTFYQEVITASDWSYRTFSVSEGSAASALLSSATGVAKQDALAYNDVQGYINSGMNYGLTNAGVLVYYADLYNRGSGIAAQLLNIAKGSGSYGDITLSTLHNTALANSSSYYTTRLNNAYNTIVSYGWGDSSASGGNGGSTTPDTSDFSESYAGTYVVTASALNVRSTPSTSGSKVGEIPNGASVAVSSANGSWAAVSYQGITGYCSMDYLQLKAADTTAPAETTTAAETTTTTAAASGTEGFSERYAGSYQVTASVLNMRSAPSVSASKVGRFPTERLLRSPLQRQLGSRFLSGHGRLLLYGLPPAEGGCYHNSYHNRHDRRGDHHGNRGSHHHCGTGNHCRGDDHRSYRADRCDHKRHLRSDFCNTLRRCQL